MSDEDNERRRTAKVKVKGLKVMMVIVIVLLFLIARKMGCFDGFTEACKWLYDNSIGYAKGFVNA